MLPLGRDGLATSPQCGVLESARVMSPFLPPFGAPEMVEVMQRPATNPLLDQAQV